MTFKTIAQLCRITTVYWASALACSVTACTERQPRTQTYLDLPKQVELLSGGTRALNYTPWYIHTFEISGPEGSGIGGGGPNVMPMNEGDMPSGGGAEMCCTSIPEVWQSDLKLTVRWLVFKDVKKLGAKAPGNWYKAENVRIAQYDGEKAGAIWAIFLPDDRVRIMVTDGNHDGGNNANNRPPDNDPYIAQGVIDDEWNDLFPNGVTRGVE